MTLTKILQQSIPLIVLLGCAAPQVKVTPAAPVQKAETPLLGSVPFTLHDNRLLVDVFLNGHGPFVMIFDAGGANTLTPEVQKILDLKSQGIEYSEEAGERSVGASSVHLKTVQAGSLKLADQKFLVINMNPIRKAFRFPHLDGVIGLEILKLGKVRIDFDRQSIEMRSVESPALEAAQSLNFEIINDKPIVDGKINGLPAKILLDTGDRSNLTLFRKFAESSKLEDLFARRETLLTGMGLHGPIQGKLTPVQKVDIGTSEISDVLTRLPMTKKGYFFSNRISASAGIGLLKSFNIEFDYRDRKVALQPRKGFNEASSFVPLPSVER